MLCALKNIDQMDRNYKNYQVRKRVITLALAACFAASAYSCYYGTERMRSERENVYLLNLAQAEQRDYRKAENCYASAVEKYRQAQANGTEDTQMAVLKNLIDQLRTSGWLK